MKEEIITQEEIIYSARQYFYNYTSWEECLNIEIILTDNIPQYAKEHLQENLSNIECKGIYLYTTEHHNNIILCDNTVNNDTLFIHIIHELTHAWDYQLYVNKYCRGDFSKLKNSRLWKGFYYWSEYHARRISIKINIDCLLKQITPYTPNTTFQDFLNFYTEHQDIKSLYDTVSYLGKYNICNDFSLLYFDEQLPLTYDNQAILQLNSILNKMNNFQHASSKFHLLKYYILEYNQNL